MVNQIKNRESLLKEIENGFLPKFMFFWGHTPRDSEVIDKSCLSQWYPAPFNIENQIYATTEHYMMAEKARLFGDDNNLQNILRSKHPEQAKEFGRSVVGLNLDIWEQHRIEITTRGNIEKFSQNEALKIFLINTNQRVLVEASPVDLIWGIGFSEQDREAYKPHKWRGLNLLGFALMGVRAQLISSISNKDQL